jgi:small subunit ribosomal protein S2
VGVDFPIPGNDDARRSIELYCNLINETINNAKKNISIDSEKKIDPEKNEKKIETSPEKKKNQNTKEKSSLN